MELPFWKRLFKLLGITKKRKYNKKSDYWLDVKGRRKKIMVMTEFNNQLSILAKNMYNTRQDMNRAGQDTKEKQYITSLTGQYIKSSNTIPEGFALLLTDKEPFLIKNIGKEGGL